MLIIRTQSPLEIMTEGQARKNVKKSGRVIALRDKRANLENSFMEIGRKANRADNQREDRRAKRK